MALVADASAATIEVVCCAARNTVVCNFATVACVVAVAAAVAVAAVDAKVLGDRNFAAHW